MDLCKVRFDGTHTLALPLKNKSTFKTKDIIEKSKKELGLKEEIRKKDLFVNEWAEENFPYASKGRKPIKPQYIKLEDELKLIYDIIAQEKMKQEILVEQVFETLTSEYDILEYYNIDSDDAMTWLRKYTEKFVERQKESLKRRKALFKRKAYANDWNYLVTFTYDDKKCTEQQFVKGLKKKLQNLHSNWQWLYMGVFEKSPTERLHFHGLVYVPQGSMRGNVREEQYYNKKKHKMDTAFINDEFESDYGRNDFKPISGYDVTFLNSLDYIMKYVSKSTDKIIYSRGIKDDEMCLLDIKENAICQLENNNPYFVIHDNTYMIPVDESDLFARKEKVTT